MKKKLIREAKGKKKDGLKIEYDDEDEEQDLRKFSFSYSNLFIHLELPPPEAVNSGSYTVQKLDAHTIDVFKGSNSIFLKLKNLRNSCSNRDDGPNKEMDL